MKENIEENLRGIIMESFCSYYINHFSPKLSARLQTIRTGSHKISKKFIQNIFICIIFQQLTNLKVL